MKKTQLSSECSECTIDVPENETEDLKDENELIESIEDRMDRLEKQINEQHLKVQKLMERVLLYVPSRNMGRTIIATGNSSFPETSQHEDVDKGGMQIE